MEFGVVGESLRGVSAYEGRYVLQDELEQLQYRYEKARTRFDEATGQQ
jgi:hypothetical protein